MRKSFTGVKESTSTGSPVTTVTLERVSLTPNDVQDTPIEVKVLSHQ